MPRPSKVRHYNFQLRKLYCQLIYIFRLAVSYLAVAKPCCPCVKEYGDTSLLAILAQHVDSLSFLYTEFALGCSFSPLNPKFSTAILSFANAPAPSLGSTPAKGMSLLG